MKVIKVILGIIIALSLVFFATGLVVKEVKYTTEITVNKPIEEVFVQFDDTEKLQQWLPDVKSIEPIQEKPGKVGSTYRMVVLNKGLELAMTEKIMAYVPKEKMTFQFDSADMIKTDDYNFSSEENKTKIVLHSKIKAKKYLMSCVFPWFKSVPQKLSQEYMNRFKEMVEKE